jgi:hypothetical protein
MIKNPLPLPCMALSSRHAGETPAHPACGLEARAPMRCRGDGVYRCMRARRLRTQAVQG